jgi:hypothetical protein
MAGFFQFHQMEATLRMLHTSTGTVVERPKPKPPTIPLSPPPADDVLFTQEIYLLDGESNGQESDTPDRKHSDGLLFDAEAYESRLPEILDSSATQKPSTTLQSYPVTPPLTHEPFSPDVSPKTPTTPQARHIADFRRAPRYPQISPHIDFTKNPSLTTSPSTSRSGSTSWAQDFQLFSPIGQKEDPLGRPRPQRESTDNKPVPVSLFKILNERQQRPRPGAAEAQSNSLTEGSSPHCLLRSASTFEARHFRATTITAPVGRRAWWCRFDNLVVFDGMSVDPTTNSLKPKTRTSKGLAAANIRGELITVSLDVECGHCRDVLGLKTWNYKAKVCSRGVCTACKAMCRQEWIRQSNFAEANFAAASDGGSGLEHVV